MPQRFAEGFDPEAVKAMMVAFDQACDRLGLARTHDVLTERLAKAIVSAARTRERDPNNLWRSGHSRTHGPACWLAAESRARFPSTPGRASMRWKGNEKC